MKEKNAVVTSVGILVITSAIIWGLVIVGCSVKLKGTGYYSEISNFLIGGCISNILIIGSILGNQLKRLSK